MKRELDELEKAISQTVKYLSSLRREKAGDLSQAKSRSRTESKSPPSAASGALLEENRRLKEERKETRRRIKAIIREIDKVKW